MLKIMSLTAFAVCAAALATEPQSGDFWLRSRIGCLKPTLEYQEGTSLGSTTNNPNSDIYGNTPWHLDYCSASNASTWFTSTPSSLLWDANGTGGGTPGRWIRGYNSGTGANAYPSADGYGVTHYIGDGTTNTSPYIWDQWYNYDHQAANYAPIVRWTYPGSTSKSVRVAGRVVIGWGWNGGPNYGVKVNGHAIIYHHKAASGGNPESWEELFDESAVNTDDGLSTGTLVNGVDYDASGSGTSNLGGRVTRAWNLSDYPACSTVTMYPGDEIVWSVRGNTVSGDPYRWVSLYDAEISITVIVPSNPCQVDYNGDGTVDFFDYLDFVDDFSQGCE